MTAKKLSSERSIIWLTPPPILDALGGWQSFDLDPCAAPEPRPWPTALRMNARTDGDGLMMDWQGRVILNPPYSVSLIRKWLARMAEHNRGTALIPASTGSRAFHRHVLARATGLIFLEGRIAFHLADGSVPTRRCGSPETSGAPSVLAAYGQDDLDRLAESGLGGESGFIPLRFARMILVAGLDQTWREIMGEWVRRQRGPVALADAYRYFERHPKARANRHWQAKVRQQLREIAERVGPATYQARAA